MNWLKTLKTSFDKRMDSLGESMAVANSLDIESFEGLMTEFRALSHCLAHLFLDKDLNIDDLVKDLHPCTIELAKHIYFNGFDAEGMSMDECQQALRNEWFLYYGDAIFLENSKRHGFDENSKKEELTHDLVTEVNEKLCDVNKTAHDMFCSYMGYKGGEMSPQRIVDCVKYAAEHQMSDGKELTSWFPQANALMNDDDHIITLVPKI